MGYVSIPFNGSGEIATHAALTQNVHGAGAYDIQDSSDLTGYKKINNNVYTGNGTANRAIAHGLGSQPSIVLIMRSGYAGWNYQLFSDSTRVGFLSDVIQIEFSVSVMDDTNFYVGHAHNYDQSANINTGIYRWVAIA